MEWLRRVLKDEDGITSLVRFSNTAKDANRTTPFLKDIYLKGRGCHCQECGGPLAQCNVCGSYFCEDCCRDVCDLCGNPTYLDSYEFIKTTHSRARSVPSDDYGKNHVSSDYEDRSDSDDQLSPSDGADIDYLNEEQKAEAGPFCEECDEPITGECDACGHTYCKDCYSDSICEHCGKLLNNEIHDL